MWLLCCSWQEQCSNFNQWQIPLIENLKTNFTLFEAEALAYALKNIGAKYKWEVE